MGGRRFIRGVAPFGNRMMQRLRKAFRARFSTEQVEKFSPEWRKRAHRQFMWHDHHVLRTFWTNFDKVAEGVYRSNQPDPARFKEYAAQGIRSILNLRGVSDNAFYHFTVEGCRDAGLTLYTISGLSATKAPKRESLLQVFDIFDKAERDLLIHCKSGADRTGLVSVFYLIDQTGEKLATARRHLSPKYLHFRRSKSGILDLMLDDFASVEGTKSLRQWIAEDYDSEDLTRRFKAK